MIALVEFVVLVAFVYYLVARAEITRWFWHGILSRRFNDDPTRDAYAHRWIGLWQLRGLANSFLLLFDRLLSCPACSGFWLGLLFGGAFPLPVPAWASFWPAYMLWGGFYGLVLNPSVQALMSMSLVELPEEPAPAEERTDDRA